MKSTLREIIILMCISSSPCQCVQTVFSHCQKGLYIYQKELKVTGMLLKKMEEATISDKLFC